MRDRRGEWGRDLRRLVVVVSVLLSATGGASSALADEQKGRIQRLTEEGAQPRTGTFSVLPWESIDMLSGNVVLSFTDLTLPGAGGFDLRIQRTLNLNTMQWRIGVAGPETLFMEIKGPTGTALVPNPVIESADGGREYTFRIGNGVYLTHDYARVVTKDEDKRLELPNGLVYHFGRKATITSVDAYERTSISDPFGNEILFVDGRITLNVKGQPSRTVIVSATGMTYAGRTWTYTNAGSLYTATLPEGLSWTVETEALPPEVAPTGGRKVKVTTPHGGWVAYSVLQIQTFTGGGRQLLKWRDAGGRGVPEGRWTFEYNQSGYPSVESQVAGPDRIVHRYSHAGCSAGETWTTRVMLGSHAVYDGEVSQNGTGVIGVSGEPKQTTGYSWTCGQDPSMPEKVGNDLTLRDVDGTETVEDARPILPLRTTVTRDGLTFSREWTYSSSAPNDYGYPIELKETGPGATRTAAYTYEHHPTERPYLLGLLKSETLTAAGESAIASSWDYAPQTGFPTPVTGFLTRRTIRGIETSFTPTVAGDVQEIKDGHGHATTFELYQYGLPTTTVTQEYTIRRGINPTGTIAWEARRGVTTRYQYDDLDRETLRTPQLGRATTTEYELSAGYWVSTKVARDRAFTRTLLDGYGRPTGTENAVGVRTSVLYDAWGRKVLEVDPCDEGLRRTATRTTYDQLGRVVQTQRVAINDGVETVVQGPEAGRTQYAYDRVSDAGPAQVTITEQVQDAYTAGGEKKQVTVQHWTGVGVPEAARLTQVTDAAGHVTSYAYYMTGQLRTVTPPAGGGRTWIYNNQGLLESEHHPESGETRYGYDAAGLLQWKIEAFGTAHVRKTAYQYDRNDRLTGVVLGSDDPALPPSVTFAYDASDNRWRTSNATATIDTTFDDANRATKQVLTFKADGVGSFTTEYKYDSYDRPMQVVYPSGRVVNYTYDDAHRLVRVGSPGAVGDIATGFVYAPSGAVRSYTLANGITQGVQYDSRQRPVAITATGALSLGYTYDSVGNVKIITDDRPGYGQTFGYDALNRLTFAQGPWDEFTLGYDAVGNRHTWTNAQGTWTYDSPEGRLQSITGPDGTSTFVHNLLGELTQDTGGTYTYTPTGMLQTATRSGQVVTHAYDADQRRLSVQVGSTEQRLYVPDLAGQVLAEYRRAGDATVLVRDHVYGAGRLLSTVESCTSGVDGLGWYAEFWDNPTRSGAPKYTRNYPAGTLDARWGERSPSAACGIPANGFSARFTRTITVTVPPGQSTTPTWFSLDADDQASLSVGADSMQSTGSPTTSTFNLAAGSRTVTVDFHDLTGAARLYVRWSGDVGPVLPWRAEYFANTGLSGSPAFTRREPEGHEPTARLVHDWSSGTPCGGETTCPLGADGFSARWTYERVLPAGRYIFHFASDDGLRVWLKDTSTGTLRSVLNAFDAPHSGEFPNSQPFEVNGHEVPVIEYVEYSGLASVRVGWTLMTPSADCLPEQTGTGWKGTFYASPTLQPPAIYLSPVKADTTYLAFAPGAAPVSPACGVGATGYGSSWRRDGVHFSSASGWFQFRLKADGPVRFRIDDTTVIDAWDAPSTDYCGNTAVSGTANLRVDYAPGTTPGTGVSLEWNAVADEFEACPQTGPPAPGRFRGAVWLDRNLNGSFEPELDTYLVEPNHPPCGSEPAPAESVAGVRVTWSGAASGQAAITGCGPADEPIYSSAWVPPGDYQVSATLPSMWRAVSGPGTVTVLASESIRRDFHIVPCGPDVEVLPTHWKGEYFANATLQGDPVWITDEGNQRLHGTWGLSSPQGLCGVPANGFSARFTRRVTLPAGLYIFKARSDGGVRVTLQPVGGGLQDVWNGWKTEGDQPYTGTLPLTAGEYDVTVEYSDGLEAAELEVWWENTCIATVPPDRWKGEYYDNATLSGSPILARDDGDGPLSFAWGEGSPGSACGVPTDDFSVRWTRTITVDDGNYAFSLVSNGGARVYLDGMIIHNSWNDEGPVTAMLPLSLTAGDHELVVEYVDHTGEAAFELAWSQSGPQSESSAAPLCGGQESQASSAGTGIRVIEPSPGDAMRAVALASPWEERDGVSHSRLSRIALLIY